MIVMSSHPHAATETFVVRVKELSERDRRRLLMHFLALGSSDRLLRFGSLLSDESLTRYVQKLDFARAAVFGIYDEQLALAGVGHIAFVSKEAMPALSGATRKARIAELGVSVAVGARGMGIGSRLFERAAIHCRNEDVDTLYMHCLSSHRAIWHIAKKAGMEIHRNDGETAAYLKLVPAKPGNVLREACEGQFALLDYSFKANALMK